MGWCFSWILKALLDCELHLPIHAALYPTLFTDHLAQGRLSTWAGGAGEQPFTGRKTARSRHPQPQLTTVRGREACVAHSQLSFVNIHNYYNNLDINDENHTEFCGDTFLHFICSFMSCECNNLDISWTYFANLMFSMFYQDILPFYEK